MHSLRILVILGLISWISPAFAMEHYVNNVQDSRGVGIGFTSVTVYNTGTLVKATIYSDNGITTTSNPLTADSAGRYDFYAANGAYDLVFSRTGYTFSASRTARITLYDVNDGGGGGGGGSGLTHPQVLARASIGF